MQGHARAPAACGEHTEADIDRMYDAFVPIQLDQIRACGALIDGAPEAARRGLDVDSVVCSEDVDAGRPAPAMILEAMKRFGVSDPAHVVNVDDTTAGVEAGRRANCWSIGVALSGNMVGLDAEELAALSPDEVERLYNNAKNDMDDAGADVVIASVAQLPAALDAIEQRLAQDKRPGDTGWRFDGAEGQ